MPLRPLAGSHYSLAGVFHTWYEIRAKHDNGTHFRKLSWHYHLDSRPITFFAWDKENQFFGPLPTWTLLGVTGTINVTRFKVTSSPPDLQRVRPNQHPSDNAHPGNLFAFCSSEHLPQVDVFFNLRFFIEKDDIPLFPVSDSHLNSHQLTKPRNHFWRIGYLVAWHVWQLKKCNSEHPPWHPLEVYHFEPDFHKLISAY